MNQTEKHVELLAHWNNGIRLMNVAHYKAAKYYRKLHLLLGIPVIVLTTFVGTSFFFTEQVSLDYPIRGFIGVLCILSAIMAGLQTFLRFAESAEKHHIAAVRYGELRREVQQLMTFTINDTDKLREAVEEIRRKWDSLEPDAPTLSERFLKKKSEKPG